MSRRTKAEKRADFIAWARKKPKLKRRSVAAHALASSKYHQRRIPNKKRRRIADHDAIECRSLGGYGMPEFGEV